MTNTTLYQDLIDAGVETNSHESDLYFPRTQETKAILEQFPMERSITTCFTNNIDGKVWFETPFAYVPYWVAVQHKMEKRYAKR